MSKANFPLLSPVLPTYVLSRTKALTEVYATIYHCENWSIMMWVRKNNFSKRVFQIELFETRVFNLVQHRASSSGQCTSLDKEAELRNAKPFEQIPGAKVLPLVGTMWQFLPFLNGNVDVRKFYDLTVQQYNKFGSIWRDVVPIRGNLVHIVTAEDAEKLLRLDGKYPNRPALEPLRKYRQERIEQFSTTGLLGTNGEDWWKIRAKVQQPMLKPQNTLLYLPSMSEVAEQMVKRIRRIRNQNNQVPDDFLTELYKWGLESISLVALDTRLGCLDENAPADSEPRKMIQAIIDAFDAMGKLELGLQLYHILPTTKDWRKLVQAQDYFTKTSLKYIKKAMERSQAKDANDESQLTMLEAMLLRGLDIKVAVTMTIDMLMGGIDTTGNTTGFLLYLLARNPEKQELLRQEIDRILPSKTTPIEPAHLNELHYLKACVKESLRLMPGTVGVGRILQEDAVLDGHRIPKGTMVMAHLQVMSRLEKYFPNPDAYIPERWIKGSPFESHASPYASLPFGFGTRACIGRRLAEQEMYLLTIKLLQNFRIDYHHQDIGIVLRLLNTPDQPLRFTFVDR